MGHIAKQAEHHKVLTYIYQISWRVSLTYLSLNKMAAISQMIISNTFFCELKVLYFDSYFTEVCSYGSN